MTAVASASGSRTVPWRTVAVLGVLAVTAAWFISRKLTYLTDFSPETYTDYFWPRRWGLLPHIAGGMVATVAGLVQLWLGFTGRTGALHRGLGRVYASGIAVGSVGAFYVALTIPPGAIAYQSGLFMLGVAWVSTTGMALVAVRRRQFAQHRDWMVRSYVVTFAFITYRLFAGWLRDFVPTTADPVADEVDTLMAWACWAVPLLLAEPVIQWRALRRGGA